MLREHLSVSQPPTTDEVCDGLDIEAFAFPSNDPTVIRQRPLAESSGGTTPVIMDDNGQRRL